METGEYLCHRGLYWGRTTDVRLAAWFKDDVSEEFTRDLGVTVQMEEVRL